jgi:Mrr restriction endonuclease-like protein
VSPSIPKHNSVDSAFRGLLKKLGAIRKKINSSAAAEMKSGEYEVAQSWIEVGRAVADFEERAGTFGQEWKRLVKATRITARAQTASAPLRTGRVEKSARTPSWKFCALALKQLLNKGGTASLNEILTALEESMSQTLTESDREIVNSRGIPRWHVAVQRANRQCQKEGWIEKQKGRDGIWKITAKGKAVVADHADVAQ